jgi:hypothetical protein
MDKISELLFHGSPKDVNKLKPSNGSNDPRVEKAVFATKYDQLALPYTRKWSDRDIKQTIKKNKDVELQEMRPNAINKIYKNKKGYLYSVINKGFKPKRQGMEHIKNSVAEPVAKMEIKDVKKVLENHPKIKLKKYNKNIKPIESETKKTIHKEAGSEKFQIAKELFKETVPLFLTLGIGGMLHRFLLWLTTKDFGSTKSNIKSNKLKDVLNGHEIKKDFSDNEIEIIKGYLASLKINPDISTGEFVGHKIIKNILATLPPEAKEPYEKEFKKTIGSHFAPDFNEIGLKDKSLPILMHEMTHAKYDKENKVPLLEIGGAAATLGSLLALYRHKWKLAGGLGLASGLGGIPTLYGEARASLKPYRYLEQKGYEKKKKETIKTLLPAWGTYLVPALVGPAAMFTFSRAAPKIVKTLEKIKLPKKVSPNDLLKPVLPNNLPKPVLPIF